MCFDFFLWVSYEILSCALSKTWSQRQKGLLWITRLLIMKKKDSMRESRWQIWSKSLDVFGSCHSPYALDVPLCYGGPQLRGLLDYPTEHYSLGVSINLSKYCLWSKNIVCGRLKEKDLREFIMLALKLCCSTDFLFVCFAVC